MKDKIIKSEDFHESTKFRKIERKTKAEIPLSWVKIHFKSYPRFKQIKLPTSISSGHMTLEKSIIYRRSKREFKNKPLTAKDVSKILFYSAGITKKGKTWDYTARAYPSAGARYPLELYPVILNVKDIPKGLYHYNVKTHSLELILEGNFKKQMLEYLDQDWIKDSAMIVLISAIFNRTKVKYGERGYRYVFLDAGHLTENIYLISTSMKLGCCSIGGFLDNKLNNLIDIDGILESVIYVVVIGRFK